MSNTAHSRYEQPTDRKMLSGSSNWDFDNGAHVVAESKSNLASRTRKLFEVCTLLFAVSPVTAFSDPWFESRRSRSQFTISSTYHTSIRRRITLREALRLAEDIMRRAEEGRIKVAEEEARRQFDLEEIT
jgi:hypothetical protein